MEWNFELIDSPKFIRIITSGAFCSKKFGEMFDDLTSLAYWRNGVPLFFDHRKLDLVSVDPLELMTLADHFIRKNPDFAFTPIAILFDNEESLEIGERYGEITEHRSLAEVRRFLCENEAIEWIRSGSFAFLGLLNLYTLASILF